MSGYGVWTNYETYRVVIDIFDAIKPHQPRIKEVLRAAKSIEPMRTDHL